MGVPVSVCVGVGACVCVDLSVSYPKSDISMFFSEISRLSDFLCRDWGILK